MNQFTYREDRLWTHVKHFPFIHKCPKLKQKTNREITRSFNHIQHREYLKIQTWKPAFGGDYIRLRKLLQRGDFHSQSEFNSILTHMQHSKWIWIKDNVWSLKKLLLLGPSFSSTAFLLHFFFGSLSLLFLVVLCFQRNSFDINALKGQPLDEFFIFHVIWILKKLCKFKFVLQCSKDERVFRPILDHTSPFEGFWSPKDSTPFQLLHCTCVPTFSTAIKKSPTDLQERVSVVRK